MGTAFTGQNDVPIVDEHAVLSKQLMFAHLQRLLKETVFFRVVLQEYII